MLKIKELKDRMTAAVARQKALQDAADAEKRELTADEVKEFDALTAQFDKDEADVKRLQAVDDRGARVAAIATEPAADATGVVRSLTRPAPASQVRAYDCTKLTGMEKVGVFAWAALKNKHSPTRTSLQHLEDHGLQQLADESRQIQLDQVKASMGLHGWSMDKALTSLATGSGGDNMIFTPLMNDFIDFLRNESVFLSSTPLELNMENGALEIPGGLAGTAATYGAEGDNIGYSQATTRKVSMAAKHLRVVTAMSNILIDRSPLAVASIVGNDVAMGMRLAIDAAGLRGDGSPPNPAGIKTLLHADHTIDAADENSPTLAEVDIEGKRILTLFRSSNVPEIRPVWIMSNRVFTYLQFLRDGNGNYAYPGLWNKANPTWLDGIPAKRSEQVPSNLGSGTDESELYLQSFGHVLMGIARSLQLMASTEASYTDGDSNVRSAFTRDETLIRGTCAHDFDMRHTKSGVLLEKVKWGAAA